MPDSNTTDPSIKVTMLQVDQLDANDWNPNTMTEEKYAEYKDEVRHLGTLPNPITVRPHGDGRYQIINGEHGHRVARELGHTEVPCQVLDLDDFEARRQTYKRNQHGEHNRVLEGRMFREMMKLRKINQRALAREIEIDEATLRVSLDYAEAADLRNRYAPGRGDADVAKLNVRQVRLYVKKLPPVIRDAWLNAGAQIQDS